MKRKTYLTILFLTLVFKLNAQQNITAETTKIHKVISTIFQGFSDRDFSKIKDNCTADIKIFENGVTWNLDSLNQKIIQNTAPDFKRINTFDFIDTEISGNLASCSYRNHADVIKNGEHFDILWLETAVLIMNESNWKIKILHSTLISRTKL